MKNYEQYIDQALLAHGLQPMHKWTADQRIRYLDGWAEARIKLKPPEERGQDTPYRRVGGFIAHFLEAREHYDAQP